ncbi:MAG: sigma-70 family RNA polymerase sigma factor [Actinomycetota bacterium]|nr:sigma-70 family RNA polymerase sigma factor [Actinomycetota bacterium]
MTLQPFEEVVAEHGAMVLRVCRALLGPDADDAWSETFLAAMRAYPDLRPDSNVEGWLATIAHRKAIDQIRRTYRAPRTDGDPPEVPTWDRTDEPDDELRAVLATLPPKQQGAVVYRYLADLPYPEVAELLGSSEAAARRSAADGIAKLRGHYRRGAPT